MGSRDRRVPNPIRWLLLGVGALLARGGVVDRGRAEETTDLAWPRIVTGVARMSKSAADVAMVGTALGAAAIAGVGFATPFWALAFATGGGVAGATISLVSQRYGADAPEFISLAVTTSAFVVLATMVPLAVVFWAVPEWFVGLIASDGAALSYGTEYLRVVAFGVPFAALNLIGSRTLVGADDAWTPMMLRGTGAVINVAINAVLIFGFGLGVVGAAIGTVVANVVVLACFVAGFVGLRLPIVGQFPVTIDLSAPPVTASELRDIVTIGAPLAFTNLARRGAQIPMLAVVALFGPNVAAAYVVARRVRDLLDTPGWGFSLASSSLVGQVLGTGDEQHADTYAREILLFGTVVYAIGAVAVIVLARQVAGLFVSDPGMVPLVTTFVVVAAISVVFRGINAGTTGPLRASGDTRWPLYGQFLGLYAVTLPLAYAGAVTIPFGPLAAVTPLGLPALYVALVFETLVPALVTYYRFDTGSWKVVSRAYRPEPTADD
ncbi:putative efflux protein, MATE family [Halorientalis persicus]|uniref:Multidrug-efflux transporter n=1 Tax=Halorientalis persicus TaxID=1367881 RepID=A0A1H8SCK2_9EURY|nr:MATE family efflux transporter [Halorientalis persicus]SEO76094.1 putative efflux protein, MATE family [Halorientalis persicus]